MEMGGDALAGISTSSEGAMEILELRVGKALATIPTNAYIDTNNTSWPSHPEEAAAAAIVAAEAVEATREVDAVDSVVAAVAEVRTRSELCEFVGKC